MSALRADVVGDQMTIDEMYQQLPKLEAAQARLAKPIAEMRRRHQPGPDGATCGQCVFLVSTGLRNTKSFYKCRRYGDSRGPATDFRKKWPACGRFEAKP